MATNSSKTLTSSKAALLSAYQKRLKEGVKAMDENFSEIVKLGKIPESDSSAQQIRTMTEIAKDTYEMQVRAATMVRAGEDLMQLVSEIKQFHILNDFPTLNDAINQRNSSCLAALHETDARLVRLHDEISTDLFELEEEFYSS